jgi:hypothetical protein
MTLAEFRHYVEQPDRQASSAIQAARSLLTEYDELRKQHIKLLGTIADAETALMDRDTLRAQVRALQRDNQRLRRELGKRHPAPWEADE